MSLELTVIIPTYRRPSYLKDAVVSVIHQKTGFLFDVMVLDNGCDKELQKWVEDLASENQVSFSYHAISEVGLHYGRNFGALHSNAPLIVYIDDDVIAPPGWLQAIYFAFSQPEIYAVAGKSIAEWEGAKPSWLDAVPDEYFSVLDLGDTCHEMHWPQTPFGCNMAFRREAVLEFGGFHPDGMGGSFFEWKRGDGETGFAKRIYEAGYKIVYSPEAWLYHRIPASRMTLTFLRKRGIKAGIGDYYFTYRENRPPLPGVFLRACLNLLKTIYFALRTLLASLLHQSSWVNHYTHSWHLLGKALYQFRLVFDPSLRRWVTKADYFTD